METHQDTPQAVEVPFTPLILVWGGVTTTVTVLGAFCIYSFSSFASLLYLLAIAGVCGVAVGLCGAWILVRSRPRELRPRRRFARILGLFLPIITLLVLPLVLGLFRISSIPMFIAWRFFWMAPFFAFFVFAGSVLGGDAAAQYMEGMPVQKLITSIFRRG